MIRPATPDDRSALMALGEATGLFQPHELEFMEGMLSEYFAGDLGEGHRWIVDDEDGVLAAAYCAPEIMGDGVSNLYFIGVHPDRQGQGRGAALLRHVEEDLRGRGVRLLLVETSGVDGFQATRAFYAKNGYDEEGRIRDYYAAGDDKVIFRKLL